MESNFNFNTPEEGIMDYDEVLLDILLKDRTTNCNIIWATNDYLKFGNLYKETAQITPSLMIESDKRIIQPRMAKEKEHQGNRRKEKAEVFTPSWLCNAALSGHFVV